MLTHLGDSLSPVTRVAVLIMEQEVEDNLCHVHKRKRLPAFRHIGESKERLLHLLILSCLQLKIILIPKWHILEWHILDAFTRPSGFRSQLNHLLSVRP